MVTSTIRKCQSKKHSGGGCDDPKCPEKVAYNAMLDNSVKTLNFDDFAKAKSKLDEKATAQNIDSLMRTTEPVRSTRAVEASKQLVALNQLENEYSSLHDDYAYDIKLYEETDHKLIVAYIEKDEIERIISSQESRLKSSIEFYDGSVSQYKESKKEYEQHEQAIEELTKNNLTNFLNRHENREIIASHKDSMHKAKSWMQSNENRINNFYPDKKIYTDALIKNKEKKEKNNSDIARYEKLKASHDPEVYEAAKKMSQIESQYNNLSNKMFSSSHKINAKAIPFSITSNSRFKSTITENGVSNDKNLPIHKEPALASYNKSVAKIKFSSDSESVKNKRLLKLKENFTNHIVGIHEQTKIKATKDLRLHDHELRLTNQHEIKKAQEFLTAFKNSPTGSVFQY